MKILSKRNLFFILILTFGISDAQSNNKCAKNIDFLNATLEEKSPSYKYLIKDKIYFKKHSLNGEIKQPLSKRLTSKSKEITNKAFKKRIYNEKQISNKSAILLFLFVL